MNKRKAEAFVDPMTGRFYEHGKKKQKTFAEGETSKKAQSSVKLKYRRQHDRYEDRYFEEEDEEEEAAEESPLKRRYSVSRGDYDRGDYDRGEYDRRRGSIQLIP